MIRLRSQRSGKATIIFVIIRYVLGRSDILVYLPAELSSTHPKNMSSAKARIYTFNGSGSDKGRKSKTDE